MKNNVFELPEITLELPSDKNEFTSKKTGFVGFPSGGEKIRAFLNQYNTEIFQDNMVDLGNLAIEYLTHTPTVITDLIEENSYLPIVLKHPLTGNTHDSVFMDHFYKPVFICNHGGNDHVEYHHIGLQSHLLCNNWDWDLDKHLRLGQIHESIDTAEVMLRNADYVDINLNVLRIADLPGSSSPSSAGLCIEDLCKIAKFIGASTHLKAITISGYNENNDHQGVAARSVAMLIWYIMDGFLLRKRELQEANSEKTYTIILDNMAGELTFIQHQKSGRWWVEMYSDTAEEVIRLACTKEDYEEACQNQISNHLTSLLSRV